MKKLIVLSISTFILFACSGCMYVIRYDGTYEGRIVDADTREPIEGVVVLGTWSIRHHNLGGGYSEYYDARETVTDKMGEFVIPGQGLRFMSNLEPVSLLIFKAGYSYDSGPWGAFKHPAAADKIKWEGDKLIVSLKRLTMEERKKQGSPPDPPDNAPFDKVKLMLKELDKEDLARGLPRRGIWKGHKVE